MKATFEQDYFIIRLRRAPKRFEWSNTNGDEAEAGRCKSKQTFKDGKEKAFCESFSLAASCKHFCLGLCLRLIHVSVTNTVDKLDEPSGLICSITQVPHKRSERGV